MANWQRLWVDDRGGTATEAKQLRAAVRTVGGSTQTGWLETETPTKASGAHSLGILNV